MERLRKQEQDRATVFGALGESQMWRYPRAIYSGFTHWKLWFSIVMLVYQSIKRLYILHPQAKKTASGETFVFWWKCHPVENGDFPQTSLNYRRISSFLAKFMSLLTIPVPNSTRLNGSGPLFCYFSWLLCCATWPDSKSMIGTWNAAGLSI